MRLNDFIDEKIKISAAIFFNDGKKFLVVMPTNLNYWEIPKGLIDKNENPFDAAIREFYEEVGIKINKQGLIKVGQFPLHLNKKIILFRYDTAKLPSLGAMKCSSMTNSYEHPLPEIEDYKYFSFDDFKKLRPELWKPIEHVIDIINGE